MRCGASPGGGSGWPGDPVGRAGAAAGRRGADGPLPRRRRPHLAARRPRRRVGDRGRAAPGGRGDGLHGPAHRLAGLRWLRLLRFRVRRLGRADGDQRQRGPVRRVRPLRRRPVPGLGHRDRPDGHRGAGHGRRRRGGRAAVAGAPRPGQPGVRRPGDGGPRRGRSAPGAVRSSPTWPVPTSPSCCTPGGCRCPSRSASPSPSGTTTTPPSRRPAPGAATPRWRATRSWCSTCAPTPARSSRRTPRRAGADGAIVSSIGLHVWEREPGEGHRDHVAESTVSGTTIARFHRGHTAPTRALTVLPLRRV